MPPGRLAAVASLLVAPLLAVALLAGCGEEAGAAAADRYSAASTSSAPVEPAASAAATSSAARPEWPGATTPERGDRVWAVYLAVDDLESAHRGTLSEVREYARSLGYADTVEGRELSCATGAAEALGRDGSDVSVALYFDAPERAEQFIALYDRPHVGYAQVTVTCLSPWAVYLAVEPDRGDATDFARLSTVAEHARSLGSYEVFSGDLGCDLGAADALGLEGDLLTVVTYFNTRAQAEEFVALYGRPYVGHAKVGMASCAE